MALIACPECNKQVSDSAPSCPNCGVAIASAYEAKASGSRLTTTQVTSKKLKLQSLISLVLIVIGIFGIFAVTSNTSDFEPPAVWPSFFLTIGFIWYIFTRLRIWWHHK